MSEGFWEAIQESDLEKFKEFTALSEFPQWCLENKYGKRGPFPIEAEVLGIVRSSSPNEARSKEFIKIIFEGSNKRKNENKELENIYEESIKKGVEQLCWYLHKSPVAFSLLEYVIELQKNEGGALFDELATSIQILAQIHHPVGLEYFIKTLPNIPASYLNNSLIKLFSDPEKVENNENLVKCYNILLDKGASVNYVNQVGETALIKAVRQNYHSGVDLLLNGANTVEIDLLNNQGKSALHEACYYHQFNMIKRLISSSASVNQLTGEGENNLQLLFKNKFIKNVDEIKMKEILALLLKNKINVNQSNLEGNSVLFDLQTSDFVDILLENGLDPLSRNSENRNIFEVTHSLDLFWHLFSKMKEGKITKTEINFEKMKLDENGNSILFKFISSESYATKLAEIFPEISGLKLNAKNKSGDSLTHTVVEHDRADLIQFFLKYSENSADEKIDLFQKNDEGFSVVDFATKSLSFDSIFIILNYLKNNKEFENEFLNFKNSLINYNFDKEENKFTGLSLLSKAVESRNLHIVLKLFENLQLQSDKEKLNFFINSNFTSEDGFEDDGSPVHFAVRSNLPDILDFLLSFDHFTQLNSNANYSKDTPLHLASQSNAVQCLSILFSFPGLKVDLLNNYDETPAAVSTDPFFYSILNRFNYLPTIERNFLNANKNNKILILGGGFVGSRFSDYLSNFNFQIYETHRNLENYSKSTKPKIEYIEFDLSNKNTWSNLPEDVSLVLITLALPNLEVTKDFYEFYLKKHASKIICYGTTSRYTAPAGSAPHPTIDETCPENLESPRTQAEEYLRSVGSCNLILSGIYGQVRQPREWLIRFIKVSNKFINLIHVNDILTVTYYCFQNFENLKSQNFIVADGKPKWIADMARYYNLPVPPESPTIPPDSKRLSNAKLISTILPEGFSFINLFDGMANSTI